MRQKIDKDYKIKVNPEQSKEIQKICFSYGIEWIDNKSKLINIDLPYLYIYNSTNTIRGGKSMYVFLQHNNNEISAEDFISKYTNNEYNVHNSFVEDVEDDDSDILSTEITPKNRTICKTVYKQGLNDFNNEMQKIYDDYNNHDIDVKYSVTHQTYHAYFSAFVTITPKQTKENLKIG